MEPLDLVLLAVMGAGGWSFVRQLADLGMACASRRWPSTPGRIVRSEVVHAGYAMGETEQVQVPSIEYSYTVSGREWRGHTVCFEPRLYTTFRIRADEVQQRYGVGTEVAVFYDPTDPGRACLEPVDGRSALGWATAGALLTATIGAAAVLLTRVA